MDLLAHLADIIDIGIIIIGITQLEAPYLFIRVNKNNFPVFKLDTVNNNVSDFKIGWIFSTGLKYLEHAWIYDLLHRKLGKGPKQTGYKI